jgi:hypothetical protein
VLKTQDAIRYKGFMEGPRNNTAHIWISLLLFCAALLFPAYYIKAWHEPEHSLLLLAIGWLGPLGGYFSWYANLFYLIALLKSRDKTNSSIWAFVSLLLSTSFLAHTSIELPDVSYRISAYGLGYMLWISSIGLLLFGQLFSGYKKYRHAYSLAISLWLGVVFFTYLGHYMIGPDSRYSIGIERDSQFNAICKVSYQRIYATVDNVYGIFYDPNWGVRYQNRYDKGWENIGAGVLQGGIGEASSISFYETKNYDPEKDPEQKKYVRHLSGNSRMLTDHLESNYAVIGRSLNLPESLGLIGKQIFIKDLNQDKILAHTTYIYDRLERRFCGHAPKGHFSTSRFLGSVLGI